MTCAEVQATFTGERAACDYTRGERAAIHKHLLECELCAAKCQTIHGIERRQVGPVLSREFDRESLAMRCADLRDPEYMSVLQGAGKPT